MAHNVFAFLLPNYPPFSIIAPKTFLFVFYFFLFNFNYTDLNIQIVGILTIEIN